MTKANLQIAVVLFGESDATRLKRESAKYIHPDSQRKSGKSQARNVAHYAGRCALGFLLHRVVPGGRIGRNDAWGYLELFDSKSQLLPNWRGNISHTEGIAVAVIGPNNVGIDVERVERSAEKVIRRVSSQQERDAAAEKKKRDPSFPGNIALWSAKEAAAKAIGIGMNFGLQRFQIQLTSKPPFEVKTDLRGPLRVENLAVRFEIYDDFLISICSEEGDLVSVPEIVKICPLS